MAPPSISIRRMFKLGAACFKQESLKRSKCHYKIDSDLYKPTDRSGLQ